MVATRSQSNGDGALRKIPYSEVAKHNTAEDCWVIIEGLVYDFSAFAADHPGGAHLVREQAGKDGTTPFIDAHSTDIIKLTLGGAAGLKTTLMGAIDAATVPAAAKSGATVHEAPAPAEDADEEWVQPPLEAILNIHDLVAIAERKLTKEGKKQAWDYYSSGACDELTYQENELAFKRIWMRPRVLVDVSSVALDAKILGHATSAPLFFSACAMCGMGHVEGELAWAAAATSLGIPFMSPNLSSKSRSDIFAAQQRSPLGHRMFQIYVNPDRSVVLEQLRACEAAGVTAVCVTVDSAVAGPRERDQRNKIAMLLKQQAQQKSAASGAKARKPGSYANRDPALNWKDVAWFLANTSIPVVLKGIQCGEDAVLAAKAGVAAILVSNHGGRNMDTARSSVEALPEVIAALKAAGLRDKMEIWLDGGIRRGSDVVKALALGADAVGLGKPAMYAMSCYGAPGIEKCVEILKREMVQTMQLCGTPTLASLSPSLLETQSLTDHSAPPPKAVSPYAPHPPWVDKLLAAARASAAAPAAAAKDVSALTPAELRVEIAALTARLYALEGGGGGPLALLQRGCLSTAASTSALALSAYLVNAAYPLLPAGFGVHVSCMACAAFGLPTVALQVVRARTSSPSIKTKAWLVKLHALLQVAVVSTLATGANAIYAIKEAGGKPHLATNHGKLGALALVLVFLAFLAALNKTLSLKALLKPKWVWGDKYHRQLGVASYLACAAAAAQGVYASTWGPNVLGAEGVYAVALAAVAVTGLALVPFVPLKAKKQ